MEKALHLEPGTVTNVYRNPWRRKQLEGQAEIIKCIYDGENGGLYEVRFLDKVTTEQRPWRWIWTAKTVSDEAARQSNPRSKKKK